MRKQPGPLLEPGRVSLKRPGQVDPNPICLCLSLFFSNYLLSFIFLSSLFSFTLSLTAISWLGPRPPWPRTLFSHRHHVLPAPLITHHRWWRFLVRPFAFLSLSLSLSLGSSLLSPSRLPWLWMVSLGIMFLGEPVWGSWVLCELWVLVFGVWL